MRSRKAIFWSAAVAVLFGVLWLFKAFFTSGVEVWLATASLTSPAQANAVLTASGYVVARRQAAVASKGTGRLVYLGVEEGDPVRKGQTIARLEDADVQAAAARARENLRLAEADLKDAKLSLDRMTFLLQEGLVAKAEYDAAEARYKRVLASIDAAKFSVREAEVAVENTRIVAPFDGTVLKKNADVGEIVAPLAGAVSSRAAVVTIADMSSLEVEADVSEANITHVSPNQNCEIRLDAYPARGYLGYVNNIVPTADRAKATVMVKIRFKDYDERVLPEMSAKITFLAKGAGYTVESVQPFLALPLAAIATPNGRQVVYRVQNGRAAEVPVVTGRRIGNIVEIKEGLKEGDGVIANAGENIRHGSKVHLSGQ
jgi:RND family efflux transporter MFP subunit